MTNKHHRELDLSGERFRVTYQLVGTEDEALRNAEAISVEQTVEFPADLLPEGDIREQLVGQLEELKHVAARMAGDGERSRDRAGDSERSGDRGAFEAVLSFAVETVGDDLPQLLNVIFGNTSLKRDVRVVRLDLPAVLLETRKGPRFGRDGLRALVGAEKGRPLLCSALKPMGLSPSDLAELANTLALGGIHIIKDDHGLADQPFCRFEERVDRCAKAVARANGKTGAKTIYTPNVTAPCDKIQQRARFAKEAGAGGLLVAPGLTGLDSMRLLAEDDELALPLVCHPALLGSQIIQSTQGIAGFVLLGQLMRLAGADAVIFPHYGGRFPLTLEDCRDLVAGTEVPMSHLKPIFPIPAGGMNLSRVSELCAFYGPEVVFLVGGDLHRSSDLTDGCRQFRKMVEEAFVRMRS